MKPTRVAIVSYHLINLYEPAAERSIGGAEVQLFYMLEALKIHSDLEFHVLSWRFNQSQIKQRQGITFWEVITSKLQPKSFIDHLYNVYCMWRTFWALYQMRADIYVVRGSTFETGLVSLFCRLFRKKFIFMLAHAQDVNGNFIKQSGWLTRVLYRHALNHTNVIFAQTEEQRTLLQKNYQRAAELLPNAFPSKLQPATKSERTDILWIGRAVHWKRPEVFVKLAKRLPQYHFTMILQPQDSVVLEQIEQSAKLLPNFRLILGVSFQDTNDYFSRARLFVNTSDAEGFPNTFIQAGLSGCPILSWNINPDDMFTGQPAPIGWWAGQDIEKSGDIIKMIFDNDILWKQYSQTIQIYMKQHHSLEQNIPKLLKAMTKL